MLYGAVAAIISLVIVISLFAIASSTLEASSLGLLDIDYSSNFFRDNLWLILTAQIAVGILIGAASSAVATRRYLKVQR
jgi:cell division protein FtsX